MRRALLISNPGLLHLLPSYPRVLVSLAYFISCLDRVNVGDPNKMKYEKQELHRIRLIRIRPTIT